MTPLVFTDPAATKVKELLELINEFRVIIIGPIRQELLSGVSDEKIYQNLKEKLHSFEDIQINTEHYEIAAELFNTYRKNGIQGSHIDFLICSVSILNNYSIYSTTYKTNIYSSQARSHKPYLYSSA